MYNEDRYQEYREYKRKERKMEDLIEKRNELIKERRRRRKYSYRYLKKVTISCSIIASLVTSTATGLIVHKVQKENYIDNKIGDYKELILDTVENNHIRGGRDDYNYFNIANTILESDNPDLALFTLYRECGTKKENAYYNRITNRTYSEIDNSDKNFDENREAIGFDNYIKENGYKNYKEYYKDCEKELINDDDNNLDNLKISIKKFRR